MATFKGYEWEQVRTNVWNDWGTATGYDWRINANYSTTATTTGDWYVQDHVWNRWTTTGSTNSATFRIPHPVQDHVWTRWQAAPNSAYLQLRTVAPETEAERRAREDREQAAREERSRRALAEKARMEGARERAAELLEMVLTAEEKLMRDERGGKITVRGSEGNLYEIDLNFRGYGGVHGNIARVDEHGCVLGRLCVAPEMMDYRKGLALPLEDGYVGQILGIKFNEAEFVAKANWSQRAACRQPNVPILRERVA